MINFCYITVSKLIIIYLLYLKVIPTTVLPSTHTSPCYHRALSMQFTVTIHLKIFAVRVNMVSYFFCTQKFLLPQCRGNVKYIQVTATIGLCQKCFIVSVQSQIFASYGHFQVMSTSKFICQWHLLLYLCTYKSLVPQYRVNLLFLLFYTQSLLPQPCVKKVYYRPYALANPCWHSSVSIRRLTAHLHLEVTVTTEQNQ